MALLDPLRSADQSEIRRHVVLLLTVTHDLFAFLHEPSHAFTRLCPRRSIEKFKAFVEPFHLGFGFLKMIFYQRLQLRGTSGFRHLRQRFQKLLFGMQDIPQLIDQ